MSPVGNPLEARFSAVYDMERVDLHENAQDKPWLQVPHVTVTLEGGPLNGWTKEYALAPDYYESPDGRYLPYMADPTRYAWMPNADARLPR